MKNNLKKAVSLLLSASMIVSSIAFSASADSEMSVVVSTDKFEEFSTGESAEISSSELDAIFQQNLECKTGAFSIDASKIKGSVCNEPYDVTKVTADPKSYYGGTNSYNFYNILTANEKLVYNTIGAALKEDITYDYIFIEGSFSESNCIYELCQGFEAFVKDHPEYFHLWLFEYTLYTNGVLMKLIPCDGQTNSGMATNYTKVMNVVSSKVNSLSSLSTYDKALALARYLSDKNTYNTPASEASSSTMYLYPNCWNAYGALINGDCVCEGYAEAYKMLCDYANIPCILVNGYMHEYNMVYMGGKWYNVDVTWIDGPEINGHYCDGVDTRYTENWFLVGSTTTKNQDSKYHTPTGKGNLYYGDWSTTLKYPTLSTTDYVPGGSSAEAPKAPSISDTVMGSNGMYIYWNAVSGATSYRVYRATSATGTKTQLGVTGSTNFCDTTAVSGKTYYYFVAAYNNNTKLLSAYSSARRAVATTLTAPGLTDSAIGDAGLYLYWNKIPGATSYRVYRADSASGTKKQLTTTANTSYVDSTAVSGKTYYYYVTAFNSNTNIRSAFSTARKITMTKISTPSLTDTCIGDAGLYLYWSSVPGATSYRIYRADSQTGTKEQILVTANLNGIDTTAVAGKTYYYFVAAFNKNTMIRSAYSTSRKVTMTKISAPIIKSAAKTSNGVALTWSTSTGATSYRIYRADSSTGAKTLLNVQAGTTFTDTTAVSGKTYYYYVAAFNNKTNIRSAMSAGKSITA